MAVVNKEQLRNLAFKSSRLVDWKLRPELSKVLGQPGVQVVNVVTAGNLPDDPSLVQRALPGVDLKSLTSLSLEQEKLLRDYGEDGKQIRFVDTPDKIQQQEEAFYTNLKEIVEKQKQLGMHSVVFTVCGSAAGADLNTLAVVDRLSREYEEQGMNVYGISFLAASKDSTLDYSVRKGIHPEHWEEKLHRIEQNEKIFFHEPEVLDTSLETNELTIETLKEISQTINGHTQGITVDANRKITEFAEQPPLFAIIGDSLITPKNLLGSTQELIARILWVQYAYGINFEEAVHNIHVLPDGLITTNEWNERVAARIYDLYRPMLSREIAEGTWRRGIRPSGQVDGEPWNYRSYLEIEE
jgi:hypothetical protein